MKKIIYKYNNQYFTENQYKGEKMGYWNTRGLRGNDLEEQINITTELYREKKLGIIQKIPTPIKPINIDQSNRTITLAYFEQKSTVDYVGVIQGIAVCFDAKETAKVSLPISNIHKHQVEFMKDFKSQGGESFLVVHFKKYEEYYLLPIEELDEFYTDAQIGGPKSIPYSKFDKRYLIPVKDGLYIHYLKALQTYMEVR